MKYSILGFNQEEVLKCKTTIDVNGKEKEVCIDVTDLLILQCVADFMNRQCVYKYIINDKMYFSIHYKALLEDLPILNIGKQALRDRIDKLVLFNLLEKEAIRNEQGSFVVFRIGTRYEQLVYNKKEEGVCIKIEGGVYQTTHGVVSNYTPKNSSTINTSTIKEKEDKSSKKKEEYDFVERMYKLYPTKCPKRGATLGKSHKDKDRIRKLLKRYSMDEIESVFNKEIEEKYEKHYMSNFSTFLNNFPDPNIEQTNTNNCVNNEQNSEQVIINGQIYR